MQNLRLYLAPFQGITSDVFMEVYTRFFPGIDKLFTAFYTAVHKEQKLNPRVHQPELLRFNGVGVVPQILSKDAKEMLRFARACKDYGYEEINWNMGCPFPRVANKKRGSGLLPYPDLVEQLLSEIMPEIPLNLSVKCRLGYFDAGEIFELIPVFNRFPLSEVIIHARTGKQMYKGETDPETFKKAAGHIRHPVIYNGNIFTVNDLKKMNLPAGTGIMVGRGVLADPFLPADIKGLHLPAGRKRYVQRFANELYYSYRKKMNDRLHVINIMKELWSYLSLSFDDPVKVFGYVKKTKDFDAYEDAVNNIFKNHRWEGGGGKNIND